jgi:hypothetical protein
MHFGFEPKVEEQGANNKGKDDARYKANHPHWKKRTYNPDGRSATATGAQEANPDAAHQEREFVDHF